MAIKISKIILNGKKTVKNTELASFSELIEGE